MQRPRLSFPKILSAIGRNIVPLGYLYVHSMVTITLDDMHFYAHHGCFEQEQRVGTHFTVRLTYTYNANSAIEKDEIGEAVNYLTLYQVIKKEMDQPSHLIENVAHRIVKGVKQAFPAIQEVHIKLCKLNPPLGGQVGQVCVSF